MYHVETTMIRRKATEIHMGLCALGQFKSDIIIIQLLCRKVKVNVPVLELAQQPEETAGYLLS